MRISLALLIVAALCAPAKALFVADEEYATVGLWHIGHDSALGKGGGCYAAAQFRDKTWLWIGATLNENNERDWFIAASNPDWSWIEPGRKYELPVQAPDGTRGKLLFFGIHDSNDNTDLIIADGLAVQTVNLLAVDSGRRVLPLRILGPNGRILFSLDMSDSAAGIRQVVYCLRTHPFHRVEQTRALPGTKQDSSSTGSSGTGFFVAPRFVLTNHHVIKDCGNNPIQVSYPSGHPQSATIFGQDETNDLALLQTELTDNGIASLRFAPRLGEPVATYGFPLAGLLSSTGNFTLGNVTSLAGLNDDTRVLQTSTPVQPGNSGGPLLDMSGSVIGVLEFQLNALLMIKAISDVPQNVNFAIAKRRLLRIS